jgi:hypothetical protein
MSGTSGLLKMLLAVFIKRIDLISRTRTGAASYVELNAKLADAV